MTRIGIRSFERISAINRIGNQNRRRNRRRIRNIRRNRRYRLNMFQRGLFPQYLVAPAQNAVAQAVFEAVSAFLRARWHKRQYFVVSDWAEIDRILVEHVPVVVQCSSNLPHDTITLIYYAASIRGFTFQLLA